MSLKASLKSFSFLNNILFWIYFKNQNKSPESKRFPPGLWHKIWKAQGHESRHFTKRSFCCRRSRCHAYPCCINGCRSAITQLDWGHSHCWNVEWVARVQSICSEILNRSLWLPATCFCNVTTNQSFIKQITPCRTDRRRKEWVWKDNVLITLRFDNSQGLFLKNVFGLVTNAHFQHF